MTCIVAVPTPWPSSSAAKMRMKARRDVRTRSQKWLPQHPEWSLPLDDDDLTSITSSCYGRGWSVANCCGRDCIRQVVMPQVVVEARGQQIVVGETVVLYNKLL
jgi:hypothetical protein